MADDKKNLKDDAQLTDELTTEELGQVAGGGLDAATFVNTHQSLATGQGGIIAAHKAASRGGVELDPKAITRLSKMHKNLGPDPDPGL